MEERIKLVLPERDVERCDFTLTDVVTVDVHGLSLNNMIRLLKLAYTGRMSSEQLNELMHPPGSKFDDFSKNPGPREFDKNHIGWSYNSCARPESSDPLLADQGVETGYVRINSTDRGKKPLSKQTVLVLFANGRIENVIVNQRTGRIVGDQVKDWSVLKD